jgi:hypothetical protein
VGGGRWAVVVVVTVVALVVVVVVVVQAQLALQILQVHKAVMAVLELHLLFLEQ